MPYELFAPGKWEFSGSGYDPSNHTYSVNIEEIGGEYEYQLLIDGTVEDYDQRATDDLLSVSFNHVGITASRPSLPNSLHDRAVNSIELTSDNSVNVVLPKATGYARDFMLRLAVNNSAISNIVFVPDGSEQIEYETDGNEFPLPNLSGTWLYSFTETAAGKFAVSLKQLHTVTQPAWS